MIATNSKFLNKGFCKLLIKKLINITKHQFNCFELEVSPDNIPAIKCYERNGFKVIKKIKYNDKILLLMKFII